MHCLFKRHINGSNTLFYYTEQGVFIQAETLDDLFAKIDNQFSPNLNAIESFLWNVSLHPEETFYTSVKRVPPGYELYIDDDKNIEIKRWWNPFAFKIDYDMDFETAKSTFVKLFKNSIDELVYNSSNQIGCELSGGFDSSSVFCAASKTDVNITALTMDFVGGNGDEREYASLVYGHCANDNTTHYRVKPNLLDFKNQYNMKYNYTLGPHWPIWVTYTMKAQILEYILSHNIKHIFNGQFGDQLLYASPSYILYNIKQKKYFKFIKELFYLNQPIRFVYINIKKIIIKSLSNSTKQKIKIFLKKEIKENVPDDEYLKAMQEEMNQYSDYDINKRIINLLTHSNYYMYVDNSFSRAAADKYDIFFKSPFGNQKLIEFMLTVPPNYLYSLGNKRFFHAEVMKELLPEKLLKRTTKAEFSENIKLQINAINRDKLWENSTIVSMGFFTKDELCQFEKKYIDNTITMQERQMYWRMINIEYWYALNPHLDKSQYPPNPYIVNNL
jgi:asparagine synthase (glutamine-hydrolysing)